MKLSKLIILSFFLYLCSIHFIYSQPALPFPFLVTTPDARAAGMGETGTAVADNINATYWNTGGLGFHTPYMIKDKKVNYFDIAASQMLPPTYYNTHKIMLNFTGGLYVKRFKGTLALDGSMVVTGQYVGRDTSGFLSMNSGGFIFGIAYGTKIRDNLGIGGKFKLAYQFMYSTFSHKPSASSTGYAFDIGLLWKPELKVDSNSIFRSNSLSFGMNLQNLGPRFQSEVELEPLPTTLRLGTALKLDLDNRQKLTIALDLAKALVNIDSLSSDPLPKSFFTSWERPLDWSMGIGTEYWLYGIFALRTGYYMEPQSLGNRNYFTFGSSVRLALVQLDISYCHSTELTKHLSNRLYLGIRVGR